MLLEVDGQFIRQGLEDGGDLDVGIFECGLLRNAVATEVLCPCRGGVFCRMFGSSDLGSLSVTATVFAAAVVGGKTMASKVASVLLGLLLVLSLFMLFKS